MTDLLVTQEALKAREEQLRLATEAAEIALWDVDLVTGVLDWPPRVRAMFGVSADAPVRISDFYEGLHPHDRDHVTAAFAAALDPAVRALYDVEYRTIGKEDRKLRWVAAKGRGVFEGDRCTRVIGTAIDITQRKRVEEELRDLNQTLERRVAEALAERKILADVVEATDAFIQVVGPDFTWLAINRASATEFERIFGVEVQAGDNMLRVLESMPEHQAAVKAVWSRALAGEVFTEVGEFGDPDHDRRFYEMKFDTLRSPDGSIVGAFQFVYDVTERMRSEARFREAEEQLHQSQKLEAVGKLTGGVAHDFNNILMVISGGLGLLERREDPAQRQRITSGMKQAVARGASLARQLLAFSRRQDLHPEVIDIARHLDRMRDLLDRTLRGDVHVTCEFDAGLWAVSADVSELELAVLNLCVNARDAMPQGGTVTIRGSNAPGLREGTLHGDFVKLSVTDCGTGMPQEVIDRAFEPFFTTKEIGRGSGLGLAQAYGFATQSGGTIEIKSRIGEGTTVTFWLPRSLDAPQVIGVAPVELPPSNEREPAGTVLLVEDDDEVAAFVTEMLSELRYDVLRASSAAAALGALANERRIDIVFSDIMMPGPMNGIELSVEVRKRRPGLPVLLTSGHSEAATAEAKALGIEILPKPYQLGDLASALIRLPHPVGISPNA